MSSHKLNYVLSGGQFGLQTDQRFEMGSLLFDNDVDQHVHCHRHTLACIIH